MGVEKRKTISNSNEAMETHSCKLTTAGFAKTISEIRNTLATTIGLTLSGRSLCRSVIYTSTSARRDNNIIFFIAEKTCFDTTF